MEIEVPMGQTKVFLVTPDGVGLDQGPLVPENTYMRPSDAMETIGLSDDIWETPASRDVQGWTRHHLSEERPYEALKATVAGVRALGMSHAQHRRMEQALCASAIQCGIAIGQDRAREEKEELQAMVERLTNELALKEDTCEAAVQQAADNRKKLRRSEGKVSELEAKVEKGASRPSPAPPVQVTMTPEQRLFAIGEVVIPELNTLTLAQSSEFQYRLVSALTRAKLDVPEWFQKGGTPKRPR